MNLSATVFPATGLLGQASTQPEATSTSTPSTPGAASTQPTKPAPRAMDNLVTWLPLILLMVVFYVFMFRNRRSQEKKLQEARDQLKRGDRVQTIGGILGKVIEVEDSKVLLKVDESSNTKIWFSRNAIHRVVTEEKAEAAK